MTTDKTSTFLLQNFVKMHVPLLLLGFISTVHAVRTCYFCADTTVNCMKNDESRTPIKQTCENFKIDSKYSVKQYIREPADLRNRSEEIFVVALSKETEKTLCMKVIYQRLPRFKSNERPATLVFQSCMYQRLLSYNDSCEYFVSMVFWNHAVLGCTMCRTHDCNSAKVVFSQLVTIITVSAVSSLLFQK